jgi:hypothetical protein
MLWIIFLLLIAGCSTASPIQSASSSKSAFDDAVFDGETVIVNKPTPGHEEFRVFHQAATGFVSVQSVRQSAEKRVKEFCDQKNRRVNVLRETTSKPPHILGNFPRIEIVFECIEVAQSSLPPSNDKFSELRNLKEMLDEGILTQEEFDAEKAKVLDR